MAESTTEVVAGGAVLAAAVAFLVYVGQSTGFSGGAGSYEVTASFRSVEGIGIGTDVRLAGVKVGSVTGLSLNPTTYFADATVSVQQDVALPVDSAILISSEGLLGGNFVELIPGGALENIEPGGEIEDTQGAVSLISLLMKFVGGSASDDTATP
ncbi:outer membrane lipid asymmetry maintenance protein MlaD [Cereibacter changlensis]|uniref:Outer membrane lipid asymmetry maintenance protein MlaD n=2 Tax=Cereibacter changlensis TaxID=402884 RepID=A0A2T4JU56_9RHOB|nr:outer membrane lipid asymmetry maintenance protein MlaD [Cereibacter changlensis]PTE21450.1 outer membrane lipid asymmetry maintenance protein MlaD [Cereibacter changlensis JA139]PZX57120.1 phospholipid/cholesterol/gamma-HCH transport system substrate-binding protein [Cereibacter changlensis]TKA94839.1 outer membrane lipid asymmetry maintenance protein MlaD [Cereibacter changlensis]